MKVSTYKCDRCGTSADGGESAPPGWLSGTHLGAVLHLCAGCRAGLHDLQERHRAAEDAYCNPDAQGRDLSRPGPMPPSVVCGRCKRIQPLTYSEFTLGGQLVRNIDSTPPPGWTFGAEVLCSACAAARASFAAAARESTPIVASLPDQVFAEALPAADCRAWIPVAPPAPHLPPFFRDIDGVLRHTLPGGSVAELTRRRAADYGDNADRWGWTIRSEGEVVAGPHWCADQQSAAAAALAWPAAPPMPPITHVREHGSEKWHLAADPAGLTMRCGAAIGGSLLVCREGEDWESFSHFTTLCPDCVAGPAPPPATAREFAERPGSWVPERFARPVDRRPVCIVLHDVPPGIPAEQVRAGLLQQMAAEGIVVRPEDVGPAGYDEATGDWTFELGTITSASLS